MQSTLLQQEQAFPVNEQAPTQDPLTHRDRQIIATIINSTPEQIKTIWIEGGITVWVQLTDNGRLPFERTWFAARVAEVKATLDNSQFPIRNSQLNTTNYEIQVEIEKLVLPTNQLNDIPNCELRIANCELLCQRNERLSDELEETCRKYGLWHSDVDWLSFSTKVFREGRLVGFVGCNAEGWYSRPRLYGRNQVADTADSAIGYLGVRPVVAA